MSAIRSFGFDEALVQRALAMASGDEELAINLILNDQVDDAAPPAAQTAPPPPMIRRSSLFNLPSHPESQRFFVVKNPEVETSNKADAYVHGVENECQTHASNGAQFPNGSEMWLGKIELGVPAIVDCVDRQEGKVSAVMQGHYSRCSCFFERKDLIDLNLDEIYPGRQVYVVPPKDVEVQLADGLRVAVTCITSFPKCWVSGILKMQSVPPGCIALPLWMRETFVLGADLVGHRLTVSYVQVQQLPVASAVTLRCVAKQPPTLPDFFASRDTAVALSNPMVILKEQMQSRQFKALTVGLRFSLFYCSKNSGGRWDFEVCRIKARRNYYDSQPRHDLGSGEVMLPEGTAGCVFSNCENTGSVACEYIDLPDVPVSLSSVATPTRFNVMKPGDQFNFQRHWPTLDFASESGGIHPTAPHMLTTFQSCFGFKPDAAAHAPGCLEFLGNHLECNGGAMHGVSIDKGATAFVAFQKQSLQAPRIQLRTTQAALPVGDGMNPPPEVSVFFDDLHKECSKESRTIPSWALRSVGVLHVMRARGMHTPCGCAVYVDSQLETGSGLRSGAAVQLAVAMSLATLYDWPGYNLNRASTAEEQSHIRMRLVQLCHAVENDVVGVPCGIFDQACSAFGQQARIVRLHFGFTPVAVRACAVGNGSDENLKMNLWVFATGVRHELADALYKTRCDECQVAAAALGLHVLSDCSLSHLEASRDALTEAQYMRAKHVIEENHRVHSCVKFLQSGYLIGVGECLTASHHSSRLLFQNSCNELDFLVDQLAKCSKVCAAPSSYLSAHATRPLLGARLIGKGWGGSCFALTDDSFTDGMADIIAQAYEGVFHHRCKYYNVSAAQGAHILNI